jgi:hypothetical protein
MASTFEAPWKADRDNALTLSRTLHNSHKKKS